MKIVVLGGGPAGLYAGLLIKKANPGHEITVLERNPAGVTYGWGVVFSDRTLASFQRADYKTYQQITGDFVIWDAIDVRYRSETIRCGGHIISSISRKRLLHILQSRCAELGVNLHFGVEVNDLAELPEHDLLIAADGVNSLVRRGHEELFRPRIEMGKSRYIWYGANKVLDAFTFIFHENEHGHFQVHAYPFSGTTSTFIVECDEPTWRNAGLDSASEEESLDYCNHLLAEDLNGAPLLSNNSKWIGFPTLKTERWHATIERPTVLLGDAAHTAHFSIGSGTKLAMEDAIALANALEEYPGLERALNEYELERKPVVETFQRAASESQAYFETIKRYLGLPPMQFAFQLLTRSGRITYDDLHFKDARFGDAVDRWYRENAECGMRNADSHEDTLPYVLAPPPMFSPLRLRELVLPNRVVLSFPAGGRVAGAGLFITGICAVCAEGRITPEDEGMYEDAHLQVWAERVRKSGVKTAIRLGHAGRRGATRPRREGLDRPLRDGAWPLIAASPLRYAPGSQVPKEMDWADMDRVRDDFVRAARLADEAGFDLIQLSFGHGYLLAGFLSPLTNLRCDEYGGDLQARMRYPLAVFDAVRAVWPESKPLSVAITAADQAKGGFEVEDAVVLARTLKEHGCDLVEPLAGQTVPGGEPRYGRGFLTHYSDRIRNEAGVATMVGGYLATTNEANTILAAGRADLCMMEPSWREWR